MSNDEQKLHDAIEYYNGMCKQYNKIIRRVHISLIVSAVTILLTFVAAVIAHNIYLKILNVVCCIFVIHHLSKGIELVNKCKAARKEIETLINHIRRSLEYVKTIGNE